MQFLFIQIKKNIKIISLFLFLLFVNQSFGLVIKKNVKIDWGTPKTAKTGEIRTFFNNASYQNQFGLLPIYENKLGKS
jgi:hypothetical protein